MGRRTINRQSYSGSRAPVARFDFSGGGVGALPRAVTIDGVTAQPVFRYVGGDATASTWTAEVGQDLAIAGAGAAPTVGVVGYGSGARDLMVTGEGGKSYQSASAFPDFGVNDFYIEMAGVLRTTSSQQMIAANWFTGGQPGILVYINASSTNLVFLIYDGSASASINIPFTSGNFYFVSICADRSGSMAAYLNGSYSTAAVISSVGSMTPSQTLWIGSRNNTAPSESSVQYFAGYNYAAGTFSTHLQSTVATERFNRFTGLYADGYSPTFARNSSAVLPRYYDGATYYLPVGAGMPCVGAVDADTSGYLGWGQKTNLIAYSWDLTNWTTDSTYTSIDTAGIDGSVVGYNAQGIVPDANTTVKRRFLNYSASAVPTVFAVVAKAGNQPGIMVRGTATQNAIFDLSAGTVGTITGAATATIEDLGGGRYLCALYYTPGAGTQSAQIWSVAAGEITSFAGDGVTSATYIDHTQIETGTAPTTPIITNGAAATRTADALSYDVTGALTGTSSIRADFATEKKNSYVYDITDGTTANRIRLLNATSTGYATSDGTASSAAQWTITGSVDTADGDNHRVVARFTSNDVDMFTDRAADGTPDTSATVPTGLTTMTVGTDESGANSIDGVVGSIKLYNHITEAL